MKVQWSSVWKFGCWFFLALTIVVHTQELIIRFLHPVGGGIFHEIFAYSGGRVYMARKVLKEYLIVDSVILVTLIICNYPLNGVVLSLLVSAIGTLSWWMVCTFPYQRKGFQALCYSYLGLVPITIFMVGMVTLFLKKNWLGRNRVG
jgi:hypothetical protein